MFANHDPHRSGKGAQSIRHSFLTLWDHQAMTTPRVCLFARADALAVFGFP